MKKIFILLTSMFLLVGCIESIAVLGGGVSNGKLVQSSIQSAASYGVKKATGETPMRHALNYVKKNNTTKEKNSCSSFIDKKDLEICLTGEKKTSSNRPSKELTSSLQHSINKKSKIKYLD